MTTPAAHALGAPSHDQVNDGVRMNLLPEAPPHPFADASNLLETESFVPFLAAGAEISLKDLQPDTINCIKTSQSLPSEVKATRKTRKKQGHWMVPGPASLNTSMHYHIGSDGGSLNHDDSMTRLNDDDDDIHDGTSLQ